MSGGPTWEDELKALNARLDNHINACRTFQVAFAIFAVFMAWMLSGK